MVTITNRIDFMITQVTATAFMCLDIDAHMLFVQDHSWEVLLFPAYSQVNLVGFLITFFGNSGYLINWKCSGIHYGHTPTLSK